MVCLLAGHSLVAQEHSVGLKGGVNIPFVNFTDFVIDASYSQYVHITGTGAITYRYMGTPKIGVQMELGISQKGWGQNLFGDQNLKVNTIVNTTNYLELPVYFRYNVLGDRKLNIAINGGFYVAYALSTSRKFANFNALEQAVAQYDLNTDNRGDFGLVIALSVSYKFAFGEIQLDGGYKPGFANILPVSHIKKENPIVSTNQIPFLSIGYLLPLHTFFKK